MSWGKNRGSRGDLGVGIGARSPWRVGRNPCCFRSIISHQHSITTASSSQSFLLQARRSSLFFFFGMPQGLSCCVGLLSVLTQQFIPRGWALPSSPQPRDSPGYKHPNFLREPPRLECCHGCCQEENWATARPAVGPLFPLTLQNQEQLL